MAHRPERDRFVREHDRVVSARRRVTRRVGDDIEQEAFVAAAKADAGADAPLYDRVAPFWQSWEGMRRYWAKKREE